MAHTLASGVVHTIPTDMRKELLGTTGLSEIWNGLTPLARNEWICWVTSVKKPDTRAAHVARVGVDLQKGKRRPCCWEGCAHR